MFGLFRRAPGWRQTRHDSSPSADQSEYLAEQDFGRGLLFPRRNSDAMLVCQISCLRDGVVPGAYEGISLLLLTRLLAWETVGNTHTGGSY